MCPIRLTINGGTKAFTHLLECMPTVDCGSTATPLTGYGLNDQLCHGIKRSSCICMLGHLKVEDGVSQKVKCLVTNSRKYSERFHVERMSLAALNSLSCTPCSSFSPCSRLSFSPQGYHKRAEFTHPYFLITRPKERHGTV